VTAVEGKILAQPYHLRSGDRSNARRQFLHTGRIVDGIEIYIHDFRESCKILEWHLSSPNFVQYMYQKRRSLEASVIPAISAPGEAGRLLEPTQSRH